MSRHMMESHCASAREADRLKVSAAPVEATTLFKRVDRHDSRETRARALRRIDESAAHTSQPPCAPFLRAEPGPPASEIATKVTEAGSRGQIVIR
eukprot:2319898-Pyramimonas_sp.AAC.1